MATAVVAATWAAAAAAWTSRTVEAHWPRPRGASRVWATAPTTPRSGRVGRWLRERTPLGPVLGLRPDDDASVTIASVVLAGLIVVSPLVGLVVSATIAAVLARRARRRGDDEPSALAVAALVDLLVVAAAGHVPVDRLVGAVRPHTDPPFARSFLEAERAAAAGARTVEVLATTLGPAGLAGRRLAQAVDDARSHGDSITVVLQRAADDLGRAGRREIERRSRTLPVRLLFPLVLCVLPACVLLTVFPLLAGSSRTLPF